MATLKTNDKNFNSDVLKSDIPVLVDFWAEWCNPCKIIEPTLEILSKEMLDKIKIVKLNVDENPEVSQNHNIRSIPALMIFKKGELIAQKLGTDTKSNLEKWILENI